MEAQGSLLSCRVHSYGTECSNPFYQVHLKHPTLPTLSLTCTNNTL